MKIGTDIVHIGRIEASIEKFGQKFLDRFLSRDEQDRLNTKTESIAGYWAAKEAIAKALGCGIGEDLSFMDIILSKDHKGSPFFVLSHNAKDRFRIDQSSLSISHDGGFAIAVAVVSIRSES
jgi:holo-[acyl-carrier protein] synthase